jgi:mannose-1-phosphate guanylyltransferase
VRYSDEPEILGTAGGIRRAFDQPADGPVVVMNSDFISDIDLGAALEAHRRSGRSATIVLTLAGKPFHGVVRREPKSGRVLSIQPVPETPRDFTAPRPPPRPAPRPAPVDESGPFEFTGLQILEPGAVDRIPAGRRAELVRDLYQPLIQEGKLGATLHQGFWWEFGTPERFLAGQIELLGRGVEFLQALMPHAEIVPAAGKGGAFTGPTGLVTGERFTALVDPAAQVSPSAILDGGVVIGPRCRVGAGARLTDSILLEGSTAGEQSDLDRVILGPGVQAPAHTRLFRCTIGRGDPMIKVPGASQRAWQGYILRPLLS